ncbi:MAG: bifunctional phosphopantothenoylcysteine decarboxylase/phosphopantothenate--cysteine ligase CoaBC [Flavobacteriaceae bacterium]|jgi:phosphopantothenoylcysteine decarboxylase/phosphopantothenate--cysteine ligase|nr:bifunctional phosphopantothenoylcysteine decarboxylase/phosphopantothenate--cysteine ligase CoaBC [Flavobacteriaceae bacterium]
MSVLEGKKILLGVTGSIAAYKSIILLRLLKREGADVQVIFSDSANNFVTQLTFSTLSEKKVLTDFFEDDDKVEWVNHVELAEWADYMIIAPITSSTLSKLVTGNADNLLVATYMSTVCDVFFAPAMDLEMYNSESTKINIKSLVERGNIFIKPAKGYLASGLNGEGRLEEPKNIFNILVDHISEKLIYNKKNILVTAGPTHEMIDPVRFISNHSSGKMGHEIAKEAASLGANVVLVTGPTQINLRNNSIKVVNVTSADEMFEKCLSELKKMDYLIMAAAVSDFKPKKISKTKIKKNIKKTFNLELVKNIDIISELSKLKKPNQKVIGFALETENEIVNAKNKLEKKQLDAIILNSISDENTCFNSDKNKIHFITKSKTKKFKLKFKNEVAKDILHEIYNL